MFTTLRSMLRDPEGKIILVWAVAQVLVGTLVFRWLEGWSTINAFYFSVVTLATVGYGDLHPTTDLAKLVTIVYIVLGLGVIAAFITELTKHRAALLTQLQHRVASLGDDADQGGPQAPGADS